MTDTKAPDAYRTISEVAEQLDLPQHVLRFWESKFSQIKPLKRSGNRRYYRPADVDLLVVIKHLLHEEGYTIRGVQKLFKEQGMRATIEAVSRTLADGSSLSFAPAPSMADDGNVLGVPAVNDLNIEQLQGLRAKLQDLRTLLD